MDEAASKRDQMSITAPDSMKTCKQWASDWVVAVQQSLKLDDAQVTRLTTVALNRELNSYAYCLAIKGPADYVSHPLARRAFRESEGRNMLSAYFVVAAYKALQDEAFWSSASAIVEGVERQSSSGHLLDEYRSSLSNCLLQANQPTVPGLWRLQARLRYAKYLAPASSIALQDIYDKASKTVRPQLARLMELGKQVDSFQSGAQADDSATRALLLQGADVETEMALVCLTAEWEMLDLIPPKYQGTWAAIPPYTSIPGTKKPNTAQTGESSAGKSE
ncbi:MAG: hypothetical protein GX139_07300 [Armatimonadetes bacterium]|jgi:hypothetical protein|nr:hypothetical protein [Armatimonadota bacterium]